MKSTFIALLRDVEFKDDLGKGDRINDSIYITNNKSVIENLVTKEFWPVIGLLEIEYLLSNNAVVAYSHQELSEESPEQCVVSRLYEIQSFLLVAWAQIDHSINFETGFVLWQGDSTPLVSSNFIAHLATNSSGEKVKTLLGREQFREMRKLYRSSITMPSKPFKLPVSQLTSSSDRASRALYIINAARGTSDLAIRVSHYCSAFETLFSTSQSELSHQLSERIACFLHSDPEERLTTYRKMKHAYAIRSKFVHGSHFKESRLNELSEASKFCDMIAREIFRKLLADSDAQSKFNSSNEVFDEYMLRTIFSPASL